MLGILESSNKVIKQNIKLLAADYKEKTGRVVCTSCPSDIQYMISSLKIIYKMKTFEFKRENAQYKNAKGDRTTISNGNLTDEKAIEFLKTNPKRIELFSKYPENWTELIGLQKIDIDLNPEELKAQIEASKGKSKEGGQGSENISPIDEEMKAATEGKSGQVDIEEAIDEATKEIIVNDAEEVSGAAEGKAKEDCCEDGEEAPCEECKEKKRLELMKMSLKNLRAAYPEVKATSIKAFVDQVINE